MKFTSYAAALAFVEAEGLPSDALEVAKIRWVNGSPRITYFVRLP